MIAHIHIGRCSIELVRRDPAALWAGRADHRDLARKAQAMILAALDAWLASLLAARAPGHQKLAELRIDLTLTPADFIGAAPFVRARLRDTLAAAVSGATFTPAVEAPVERTVAATDTAAKPARPEQALDAAAATQRAILPALVTACEEGQLDVQLALMRAPALFALAMRLLGELGEAIPRNASASATPSWTGPISSADHAVAAALRAAIRGLALAHLMARNAKDAASPSIATSPTRLTTVSDAARTLAGAIVDAMRHGHAGRDPAPGGSDIPARAKGFGSHARTVAAIEPLPAAAAQPSSPARILPPGRYACDSLLPFLMLQPLARHGLLPQTGDAAIVAQALALTAAGAGDRRRTARLFANSADALSGAQLVTAARRVSDELERQAAAAGAALLAGHREGMPLLAFESDDGLLVIERDGLAPIAVLTDGDAAAFGRICTSPIYLPGEDRASLDRLAAALCPGAPGRGEAWATVHGPRGWIGATTMEPARAAAAARHVPWLEEGIDRARASWAVLSRPALPVPEAALVGLALLRRALGVLAGFALSEIGLALARRDAASWADPDPLLVIERFASLAGEIVVEPRRVTVTLPMGRRFTDLRDAGLLATLAGIPWWPGRRIDFTGG